MDRPVNTFEECRLYTRQHAKTFYFASHVLPLEKRYAAYAVYSFCRHVDDVTDVAGRDADPSEIRRRLDDLRDLVSDFYQPTSAPRVSWEAFRETVRRYRIPREYFLDLIRGVEMDLTISRYTTFGELQEYCYCVASVVGLMMTRIFGASDDRALGHAVELGTAMQLTNILRDVGEDLQLGRVYLPADELRQFEYTEDDLKQGVRNGAFVALMKFQIERAREYYARASAGIPMLSNDGSRFCVHLMSTTYEGILASIEANGYDVFHRRAFVPLNRKLGIALASALDPDRNLRLTIPWSGGSRPAGFRSAQRNMAVYSPPAH